MDTRQREVETKYDVDATTALPDLSGLPGVARVDAPTTFRLEASYFDTPDLALGRHGITLRRRTGGTDAGWHLKLPEDGARHEIRAALGRSATAPPVALRRIVQGVVRDGVLGPVATLTTQRTLVALRDEEDRLLAELCDDSVTGVTGVRADGVAEEHAWREWELERHHARDKLVRAADTRIREAGARPAAHGSKVGRLLALEPWADRHPPPRLRRRPTEHELLGRHLVNLADEVQRLDPLARADVPDAVHQLRVVFRRLRSSLGTFAKSFDRTATDPMAAECAWIGDVLGRPRDLEVLREHLDRAIAAEPPALVRGRVGTWIGGRLRAEHREAHRAVLDAMASERYVALVDTLDLWRDAPPWRDERDRPATKRLPAALHGAAKKMGRAARRASALHGSVPPADLHDVRKAAKRARYAAEVLGPVAGPQARAVSRDARKIQTVLGDHHDAIVAADHVLRLADAARAEGRDAFTLGVLRVRFETEAAAHRRAFERAWGKGRKRA